MPASPGSSRAQTSLQLADPINWARYFWQRKGLGADEEAFIAMSSVMRFHRLMLNKVEPQLRSVDLTLTDYSLLMSLHLSETGMRLISQLARSLMVHATTATLACDRLEARGLVQRTPHPSDRRAVHVSITAAGRRAVAEANDALREVNFGLADSSVEDQETLSDVLARLRLAAGDTDTPVKGTPEAPAG
jgi:DNA-binding MarR family transcriptional regulator